MARLVFEVEIQNYTDGDDDESSDAAILGRIRDALVAVVSLCDESVGTFCKSEIHDEVVEEV